MKKIFIILGIITLVGLMATVAMADTNTDTVTVNYTLTEYHLLDIDDASVNIATTAPTDAGQSSTSGTVNITYDISNNVTNYKITGKIDSAMPTNTALKLNLTAPTNCGGTSAGAVSLTATDQDLVTGIGVGVDNDINGTFSLTAGSGVAAATGNRTCTLTLTAGP